MALFKLFKGHTPSSEDAQQLKADAELIAEKKPTTKSAPKKKVTKDVAPKKVSKAVQDKLKNSEKIAAIAVIQTASKISDIGKYSHYEPLDDTTGTHYFDSELDSYVGWKWAVSLSLLDESGSVTIDECNLVPGPESIKVHEWIPFKDRLKPNDLSDLDSLPYDAQDPRLEPFLETFKDSKNYENHAVDRERVLSPYGKSDLSARWYEGNHGPHTASTRIATAQCMSCAFYIPLAGDLGQVFGVCGNMWSRDDGRVVSSDHGCGMHSETDAKGVKRWKTKEFVVDQVNTIDFTDVSNSDADENVDAVQNSDNSQPESE
jgi:hypothetical protein